MANNLRDIATDAIAGKRTLAVRLGRRGAGWCYVAFVLVPFAAVVGWSLTPVGTANQAWRAVALFPLLAVPLVVGPVRTVSGDASGRALLPVLAATGRLQLAFGVLLSASLWLWIR